MTTVKRGKKRVIRNSSAFKKIQQPNLAVVIIDSDSAQDIDGESQQELEDEQDNIQDNESRCGKGKGKQITKLCKT